MSRIAAIDTAVRWQLASDNVVLQPQQILNTQYNTDEKIERFLLGVSNRLRLDTPPLQFDWSTLDAARVGPKTLLVVMNLIEEKTRALESSK
jgi:hypothetical protein